MTHQISLPIEVRPEEVMRKQTLGGAIELCAELGGYALEKENRELREDLAAARRLLGARV